ncbi:inner membrane-spanning protein YciB [Caulobacter sp. RL271]|uniref:Inner membrane-spanning protein YciB n=1 Tax=Caulobacter segnis TaxID=88688 RepID=A0ABY4ZTR1_9CAUL|nr:inner membrane-spanning protein YciB [Caulobacter segnis]USQ96065.1 septation protein A [Caulobacter segnis]
MNELVEAPKKNNGWVRTVVDYGAAIAFGAAYFITKDFQKATWVLVAASAAALAIGFAVERRLALLPLFFGGMALIFGTLGLIFHSDVFVKIKVTVINLALAAFLFGGVIAKRQPLKLIMGEALHLPDAAWRTLTLRYGGYFGVVALLNEIVRNTQGTDTWVKFRLGLLPLALVFVATQVPFMMKHMAKGDEPAAAEPPDAGF